jgi:hypothetical protein
MLHLIRLTRNFATKCMILHPVSFPKYLLRITKQRTNSRAILGRVSGRSGEFLRLVNRQRALLELQGQKYHHPNIGYQSAIVVFN